jgi:DNA-directed RNA polymerase subunit RPC12/RpoP
MGIKFICPKCGEAVIGKYIKPSDQINCPHCQCEIVVPPDISETNEESNIIRIQKEKSEEILAAAKGPQPNSEIIAYIVMIIGGLFMISGLFFPLLIPFQGQAPGGASFLFFIVFLMQGFLIIAFGKGLSCLLKIEYNSRITNDRLKELANKIES